MLCRLGANHMKRTVLLVEQNAARRGRLEFLLNLAGYRIQRCADVEEALNWSLTRAEAGGEHCLLIGTPGPLLELASLFQLLHAQCADLAVLLVNRTQPPLAPQPQARQQLARIGVHICEATEISEALTAIFDGRTTSLPWCTRVVEGTREANL